MVATTLETYNTLPLLVGLHFASILLIPILAISIFSAIFSATTVLVVILVPSSAFLTVPALLQKSQTYAAVKSLINTHNETMKCR